MKRWKNPISVDVKVTNNFYFSKREFNRENQKINIYKRQNQIILFVVTLKFNFHRIKDNKQIF